MGTRWGRKAVLAAAGALSAPSPARPEASGYPARAVRVVNAYSSGGLADKAALFSGTAVRAYGLDRLPPGVAPDLGS